jgi:peptide methionine sulfoxide reductase MsrB
MKKVVEKNEATVFNRGTDEAFCEWYEREAFCEWYECEKCGDDMITESSNYCPNCGRKIIH